MAGHSASISSGPRTRRCWWPKASNFRPASEGDRLLVHFENRASKPHTIHFHGVHSANMDGENEFYAVNGYANYYAEHPITIKVGEKVRIYLTNMTEFDLVNNFHLHANMFDHYPNGTTLGPAERTDTVNLCQGQRGIIEFNYKFPGMYMFHAHTSEFAELGWMGFFHVKE